MSHDNGNGTALTVHEPDQGRGISAFASAGSFESAQRMARAIAASSLVPKEYQGSIPNCLIAMELASRTGASVFMVMQNLDVIHNRPAWRSQFLIAAVNSSGRFTPLRFDFEGEQDSDEWGCRAYATDKDTGQECIGSLITIGLAKAEGWHSKSGSKWKTMPEQMLRYRAGAFWTRVYCPEIALGMQTAEEIVDVLPGRVDVDELEDLPAGGADALNRILKAEPVEDDAETEESAEQEEDNYEGEDTPLFERGR